MCVFPPALHCSVQSVCPLAPVGCVCVSVCEHVWVWVCVCVRECECVCECVACSFPAWMCFWALGGQAAREHMASHCSARGSAFHTHTQTHMHNTPPLVPSVTLSKPPAATSTPTHRHRPSSLLQGTNLPPPHPLLCYQLTHTGMNTHSHTRSSSCPEVIDTRPTSLSATVGQLVLCVLCCCCWINSVTPAFSKCSSSVFSCISCCIKVLFASLKFSSFSWCFNPRYLTARNETVYSEQFEF